MLTETIVVLAWRERMFHALGVDPELAETCALLDIDWHDMADLLEQGCDQGLALRILA
jgi:hypothetical protein